MTRTCHPFAIALLLIGSLASGVFAQPTTAPARQTSGPAQRPWYQTAQVEIKPNLPTLWIIGDSTVRQGRDNGDIGQWGWGNPIRHYFDETKINIQNRAVGGTSSRTFMRDHWPWIMEEIKPGDYLIMQFGHNDASPINDNSRARGVIRSNGEETEEIDNMLTKQHEVVHSYGWYLRKFISDAKSKGAVGFAICTPIPRSGPGPNGQIAPNSFNQWAEAAAKQVDATYIDLNQRTAKKYIEAGREKVLAGYFPEGEATHTSWAGAIVNAESVLEGLKEANSPLVTFIKAEAPRDLKNPTGRER